MQLALFLMLVPAPAFAGIHYSGQPTNELPAEWPGFLRDHRAVRLAGTPASPLTKIYSDAATKLEVKQKIGTLSADELADLGALYLRLNQPVKALAILRPAARTHAEHFRLAANLGTAWQMNGDLDQARIALSDAVASAPKELKEAERLHLKLVTLRAKEKKNSPSLDDFFGNAPPKNAVALVQQLCIWMPNDPKLLWQLAELANTDGDVRTAANLLDGAVTEFGLKSEEARARRVVFRNVVDELAKKEDHQLHKGSLKFASSRAFPKLIDESKLPKIDPKRTNALPWAVLVETTVGNKFDVKFLPYVNDLDGLNVSLIGFVRPNGNGAEMQEFFVTEFPIGCWFCESPGPTQIVWVELVPGTTFDYQSATLEIVGKLSLNKLDAERPLMTITGASVKRAQ